MTGDSAAPLLRARHRLPRGRAVTFAPGLPDERGLHASIGPFLRGGPSAFEIGGGVDPSDVSPSGILAPRPALPRRVPIAARLWGVVVVLLAAMSLMGFLGCNRLANMDASTVPAAI
jgi:hypothetical protein